jgi:polar amino acid transport system substrate-binding protein
MPGSSESTLDRVRERGSLRVAVTWSPPPETGFPPEFYLDPLTREPSGLAVILARLLAADLDVEAEFIDGPWGEQFQALEEGRVDLLPKPTLTPRRALAVDFSTRLVPFNITAIARRDRSLTVNDLAQDGFRFSVWAGSSIIAFLRHRYPTCEIHGIRERQ